MGNAPRLRAAICRIGDKEVMNHDDVPILPFAGRPVCVLCTAPWDRK